MSDIKDRIIPPDKDGVGHVLADINCPHCGAPPSEHRVENYSLMWHDGDVMCNRCGKRVRTYDAG